MKIKPVKVSRVHFIFILKTVKRGESTEEISKADQYGRKNRKRERCTVYGMMLP